LSESDALAAESLIRTGSRKEGTGAKLKCVWGAPIGRVEEDDRP